MTRATRNSSTTAAKSDNAVEPTDGNSEECAMIPENVEACAVKVIVAPAKSLAGSQMHNLPHPQNGAGVLFLIGQKSCDEIISISEPARSWFYGETCVEDGSIRAYFPFHPVFIALPYFIRSKDRFIELTELLSDENFPSLAILQENTLFNRCIDMIADVKEVCDTKVVRLNHEKALNWLKTRLEKIKAVLIEEGTLHKAILNSVDVLDRYAFGILCDYLSPDIVSQAKEFLQITDEPILNHVDQDDDPFHTRIKRKAEEDLDMLEKMNTKKPRESAVKKQLEKASKGTKSISSFFNKK